MSIKIMSKVWEHSSHEGSPLLLLLALADHASDDGVCWPGIARLARKTRKTERHTKRLLIKLEESGEVYIAREVGRGNTNMYYITLGFDEEEMVHTLIKRFEFDPAKAAKIVKQVIQFQKKGDTQDTFSGDGEEEKGDIQGQEKVTPGAEKVTPGVVKDDIAMSPESSLTVIKPSKENRQKDADFPKNPKTPVSPDPGGSDPVDAPGFADGLDVYWQHQRITEEAQSEAGNHAVPVQAGGADAAASAAMGCFCAMQGEAPNDNERQGMLREFAEILKPLGASIEEIETAFEIMAKDFEYRIGNYSPYQDSFKRDLATCIRRARGKVQAQPDRRARDVEAMEASLAALGERTAARAPPVEDDKIGQAIKSELQLQMTGPTFDTWVKPARFACDDGVFAVTAPNVFTKDWLENRLAMTIRRELGGFPDAPQEVRFEVGE